MQQKKQKIGLLVSLGLFVLALLIAFLFAGNGLSGAGGKSSSILISEVMASNRTYPAPNGKFLDYIEVRNVSDTVMDISGYMLTDAPDAIGYTFPAGTVLQPGGHAVCWCDKDDRTGLYGTFGISKDGNETIWLYNGANVVVDRVDVPQMQTNVPLIRVENGAWQPSSQGTPGFENSQAGYDAWLKAMGGDTSLDVQITEVMAGGNCLVPDGTGRVADWVELYNPGSKAVDLSGCYLSDDPMDPVKWQIPSLILEPGQRRIIRCAGDEAQGDEAHFLLPRDGCTVILSGKLGNALCQVEVPSIGRDIAWALQDDGSWRMEERATPGYENTQAGYDAWLADMKLDRGTVVITEIMSANYSTLQSQNGQYADWVELHNTGSSVAVLTGCYLSDDPNDRGKWKIPDLELAPGQRVAILCAGKNASSGEATFSLSREGCPVLLSGSAGNLMDRVDVPAVGKDEVWALQANGSWKATVMATPGRENTEAGYLEYMQAYKPEGPLVIWEVMPSNSSYFVQSDGKYHDWVELKNTSDHNIELSDYWITDDPDEPQMFRLPQRTLAPGEYVIVICAGDTSLAGDFIQAPFSLSRQASWLYIVDREGSFLDHIRIYDVPNGSTVGRMETKSGTYYFTEPTPAKANGTGVVFISDTPVFATAGGVYNDVTSVKVELSGKDIRYTTDGSLPTSRSEAYSGPVILTKTTVIRAASFEEGKARSDVATASYIINENHTLPVMSISTEPDNLFGYGGLYVNYTTEREVPCNATLYEGDGGFAIDCGLKMFGHMGLTNPKKSFKINFRGKYGQDLLTYPVYGDDGPQVYDSLVVRAGQDYMNTIFRDELFTSLCREASDTVLAQRHKFCILYLNGEYWGIYCIKEAFGEMMYAQNFGVDASTVTVVQAPVDGDTEMMELIRYCRRNDLSLSDNYEYFSGQMDVDSLIDWIIFEGYSANTDIQQNLRYFRSSANGNKWQFAYYDIDWGWYYRNGFIGLFSEQKTWQHMPLCKAPMKNAEFREKFFTRVAELKNGVLSNEHVLARIDAFAELLRPEIQRERERWGGTYENWEENVEKMKNYITGRDHWGALIEHLQRFVGLTDAEYQKYFGG